MDKQLVSDIKCRAILLFAHHQERFHWEEAAYMTMWNWEALVERVINNVCDEFYLTVTKDRQEAVGRALQRDLKEFMATGTQWVMGPEWVAKTDHHSSNLIEKADAFEGWLFNRLKARWEGIREQHKHLAE